jgi:hypothetical protein
MDITGLPGMAETAGIFAYSSALHGMSVAEAVQATMTHLWVWTWATPEAKAKRAAQEQEEGHDPVLERLMAEAREIREAPLSAFAADAGLGEDGEEIQTPLPPVPARHYREDALEEFEDAAAWDRF